MSAPSSDFEALYGQALELVKAFPEYQFKTVTAMLVVIGWLVSSETAQKFIRIHADTAFPWGVAAFSLLLVLKAVWIYGHTVRLSSTHRRLLDLAPEHNISAEGLAQLAVGRLLPVTYFIVNSVLCIAGSVALWLICYGAKVAAA